MKKGASWFRSGGVALWAAQVWTPSPLPAEGHGRAWLQQELLPGPPTPPPGGRIPAPPLPRLLDRPPAPTYAPSAVCGEHPRVSRGRSGGAGTPIRERRSLSSFAGLGPRGGVYLSPSGVSLGQATWREKASCQEHLGTQQIASATSSEVI